MGYSILPNNYNYCIITPTFSRDKIDIYTSHSSYNYYNSTLKTLINICLTNKTNTIEFISKIINFNYDCYKLNSHKHINTNDQVKTPSFYDFIEIVQSYNIFNTHIHDYNILIVSKNFFNSYKLIDILHNFQKNININIFDDYKKCWLNEDINIIFYELDNDKYKDLNMYTVGIINALILIFQQQSAGGTAIIKVHHIIYKPIIDLIYLLTSMYENVFIVKPYTSNILTNEKYIVCRGYIFNQNKKDLYNYYYSSLKNIHLPLGQNIQSILENTIPYYFITQLNNINIVIVQTQLQSITNIITILKNKHNEDKLEMIRKINIQKSMKWCERYKLGLILNNKG